MLSKVVDFLLVVATVFMVAIPLVLAGCGVAAKNGPLDPGPHQTVVSPDEVPSPFPPVFEKTK